MNIRRTAHIGIIALGAALAMLAFAAVSSVGAQSEELSIGSASVTTGESASVALAAANIGEDGLGAWSVDITYDPAIVSVTDCDPDNGSVCNEAFGADTIRVVGADAAGLEGSPTLADITFRCDSAGTSTLALSVTTFADASPGDLQPIDATVSNGAFTCAGAAGGPTIQMESGHVPVGEQVVLDLEALGIEAPGVGAWTVDVSHDTSVATATSCLPANGGVCNAGFADDTVRATGANASGLEGNNMLAQITYRCDVEGSTDLTLTIQVLVDATVGDPQFIETAIVNGTLTCGDLPATATPVPGTTPGTAMEPPDAGTGDFGPGDAGFFGLLVAGLIGAGLAWLIAGFAGARLAPAGGLSLPSPPQSAGERQGRHWFESARRDLTDRGLPSVIRFRRVGEPRDREE